MAGPRNCRPGEETWSSRRHKGRKGGPSCPPETAVEVGNGHGGSGPGRQPVDLGLVSRHDLGFLADQPLAPDGKPPVAPDLGHPGLLEKGEGSPAGADEYEGSLSLQGTPALEVAHRQFPAIGTTVEVGHPMAEVEGATVLPTEPVDELAGKFPKIHVRSGLHPGGGHRHILPPLDKQGSPLTDDLPVLGVFHIGKEGVGRHALVPRLEKVDLLPAVDEAYVRDRIDEVARLVDHSLAHGVSPELLGLLELLENLDRLGNLDPPVLTPVGGIAKLADPGVPGSCIVPAVGTLPGQLASDLEKLDPEARVEALQQGPEVSGHDPAPDEHDVHALVAGIALHENKGLLGTEHTVPGITKTRDDIPVLVQFLVEGGGKYGNARMGFLHAGHALRGGQKTQHTEVGGAPSLSRSMAATEELPVASIGSTAMTRRWSSSGGTLR